MSIPTRSSCPGACALCWVLGVSTVALYFGRSTQQLMALMSSQQLWAIVLCLGGGRFRWPGCEASVLYSTLVKYVVATVCSNQQSTRPIRSRRVHPVGSGIVTICADIDVYVVDRLSTVVARQCSLLLLRTAVCALLLQLHVTRPASLRSTA